MLDAIVIGGGPSGLGASLALSGWQPHLVTGSSVADRALSLRLKKQVPADGLIPLDALPDLAAAQIVPGASRTTRSSASPAFSRSSAPAQAMPS